MADSSSSVSSTSTNPPTPPNPPPLQPHVVFQVPNMNHNLSIKLAKDNFPSWRTQILAYLKGQDAYSYVDGSSCAPCQVIPNPSTDADAPATIVNPEYQLWNQRDQMILSVLISTLSDPYIIHAVGCVTSHDLWRTLITMFASQARARVLQIHFQLATTKKGNSSITEYYQKIKTMSDTLAAAGQPLNDFESVSFLLAGLGSDYDSFVTSVTTRVDPLSVDELFGHLLAHEMRIEQHLSSMDLAPPTAHLSARSNVPRGRGYRGRGMHSGGRGSYRGRGFSSPARGRGSFFQQHASAAPRHICQLCGKPGHTASRCYSRFDQSFQNDTSSSSHALYSSPTLNTDEDWYPDTGATHHITHDMGNLNLTSEEYPGTDQIRIGNGSGSSNKDSAPSRSA